MIFHNWAIALSNVGELDAALEGFNQSAQADKKAGRPLINVIGTNLEVLRIAVKKGQHRSALPEIEGRLAQVAEWWQQSRQGRRVPEAPDLEFLSRVYISALDIAKEVDYAQKDWNSALKRLESSLQVKQAIARSAADIGQTRYSRATVLIKLGWPEEAKEELEACLELFADDPTMKSKVRHSLADLFDELGDTAQAIRQVRQALAICEHLPDPAARAVSHSNLAIYLEKSGGEHACREASRHQLAALVYCLCAGLNQRLQTSLGNYIITFRKADAAGRELLVPRLAEQLADPAFATLAEWLAQRRMDLEELQQAVDQILAQCRQRAFAGD